MIYKNVFFSLNLDIALRNVSTIPFATILAMIIIFKFKFRKYYICTTKIQHNLLSLEYRLHEIL